MNGDFSRRKHKSLRAKPLRNISVLFRDCSLPVTCLIKPIYTAIYTPIAIRFLSFCSSPTLLPRSIFFFSSFSLPQIPVRYNRKKKKNQYYVFGIRHTGARKLKLFPPKSTLRKRKRTSSFIIRRRNKIIEANKIRSLYVQVTHFEK